MTIPYIVEINDTLRSPKITIGEMSGALKIAPNA